MCYWLFVRTRGQTLLELLGLVGVLKDEGVDVGGASDLELDVVDLLVLLYAGGCNNVSPDLSSHSLPRLSQLSASPASCAQFLFLLRPQPPPNKISRRTAGILAPADLDELLDVGNFGRHLDDLCVDGSLEFGIDREVRERNIVVDSGPGETSLEKHGLQRGWPQALLLRAWWGDDVCGVNERGNLGM